MDGAGPYFCLGGSDADKEAESFLNYLVLSLGPMNKDMRATINHFGGIAHLRKSKSALKPIAGMRRVQLMVEGMRRKKRPRCQKIPFMVDDLRSLRTLLDVSTADRRILRCSTLPGWFFMLRMS